MLNRVSITIAMATSDDQRFQDPASFNANFNANANANFNANV